MITSAIEFLFSPFGKFEDKFPTIAGYTWGLMSACCLAISSFFVKRVSKDIPSIEIFYFRSLQIAIYTYLFMVIKKMQFHYKSTSINRLLMLRGLIGTTSMAINYYAIRLLPLSDATVIMQINPVLTGILASLVLGEKYELTQLGSALFCLVGVTFIAQPPSIFGESQDTDAYSDTRIQGTVLLVISGFVGAGVEVLVRKIGVKTNVGVVTFLFVIEASMVSAIGIVLHKFSDVGWYDFTQIFWNGLFSFLHQLVRARAFVLVSAGRMTNMGYFGVIVAFLLDIFVMRTEVSFLSALGTAFIFSSLAFYLCQVYMKEKKAQAIETK